MRNVTSHDVAKLAGVSQPTVSRALLGQRGVAPETRRRIEIAVEQLGYVPNISGRNLSTKRTNVIGIVVNELENPFFVHLIDALHSRFQEAGYRIFLYTDEDDEGVDFTELADGTIAGVVLSTANLDSRQPMELLERGLPCVLINRGIPDLRDRLVGRRQLLRCVHGGRPTRRSRPSPHRGGPGAEQCKHFIRPRGWTTCGSARA